MGNETLNYMEAIEAPVWCNGRGKPIGDGDGGMDYKGSGNGKCQWNLTTIYYPESGRNDYDDAGEDNRRYAFSRRSWDDGGVREVSGRVKVSKSIINEQINFNGTMIEQDEEGNIRMRMDAYMESVKALVIKRERRKEAK